MDGAAGLVAAQYMIGRLQRAVRDLHNRPLLAAFACQAVEQGFGIAVLLTSRTLSRLNERRAQVTVALAGLATPAPATTLIVARTQTRPRGQMLGPGKTAQVGPDFGYDD